MALCSTDSHWSVSLNVLEGNITLKMLKCHPMTAFMKTHANFKKIFLIRAFWFKYIYYCHKVKLIFVWSQFSKKWKIIWVLGFIRHLHLYFGYHLWISSISFIQVCPWTRSLQHSTVQELICKNEFLLLLSHEIALKRVCWINLQRRKRTECVKLQLGTLVWNKMTMQGY